jgi:hypothetical protein
LSWHFPKQLINVSRRPTFAPPITFDAELDALISKAESGKDYEPGYGRLWAVWENPKRTLGKCKGFELRAGKGHDGPVLVQIRVGYGQNKWWTGPNWCCPQWTGDDAQYEKGKARFLLRCQLRESGIREILRFADSPEEVMREGARKAKICCRCSRELTDPTSMALGVGPECIKHVAWDNGVSVEAIAPLFREREERKELAS